MMGGEVSFPPHLLTLEFLKPGQARNFFDRVKRRGEKSFEEPIKVTVAADGTGFEGTVRTILRRNSVTCSRPLDQPVENGEQLERLATAASGTDVICASFCAHRFAERLAEKVIAPLVNLGSDWAVPCQVLADCYTMYQQTNQFSLCFLGHPGPYCHSLMRAAALLDFELFICPPEGLTPDSILLESLRDRGTELRVSAELAPVDAVDFVCLGSGYEAVAPAEELRRVLTKSDVELLTTRERLDEAERPSFDFSPENDLFKAQRSNREKLLATLLLVYNQSDQFS